MLSKLFTSPGHVDSLHCSDCVYKLWFMECVLLMLYLLTYHELQGRISCGSYCKVLCVYASELLKYELHC